MMSRVVLTVCTVIPVLIAMATLFGIGAPPISSAPADTIVVIIPADADPQSPEAARNSPQPSEATYRALESEAERFWDYVQGVGSAVVTYPLRKRSSEDAAETPASIEEPEVRHEGNAQRVKQQAETDPPAVAAKKTEIRDEPPQGEIGFLVAAPQKFTDKMAKEAGERAAKLALARAEKSSADEDNPDLSPELKKLKKKVRKAVDLYRNKLHNTRDHSPWEIMHSLIGYGVKRDIWRGAPGGKKVNAIGWLCFNGPCAGYRLYSLSDGKIEGHLGPGYQGHSGQYLAMLAQSRVKPDFPMKIEGKDFTVADLVEYEKRTCEPGKELTFKLIGISHYGKLGETWKDDQGRKWDVARLIKEEIRQPIIGAACGGTHRLFGLAYGLKKHVSRGGKVTGQYRRAEIYLNDYFKYAFKMQNPDGGFSTLFFAGRGDSYDPQLQLETTGHIGEWLAFSLSEERLRDKKMVKAIDHLAELLIDGEHRDWKVGHLGHAIHALNLYDERVFRDVSSRREPAIAKEKPATTAAAADEPTTRTASRPNDE